MDIDQAKMQEAIKALMSALPKGKLLKLVSFVPKMGFGDAEAGVVQAFVIADKEEDLQRVDQIIQTGIVEARKEYGLSAYAFRMRDGKQEHSMAFGRTQDGMTAPVHLTQPDSDGYRHAVILGSSAKGKSMLTRLNDAERQAWAQWMDANPGVNGMEWPGWADVVSREMGCRKGRHVS